MEINRERLVANLFASDNASLIAALKVSQAGDTVLLKEGTYNALFLRDLIKQDVVIRSADPSRKAQMSDLSVMRCSGLTFREIDIKAGTQYAATITSCSDVTFDSVHVYGSLDGDARNDGYGGIIFKGSQQIKVLMSEFEQLYWGIAHFNSEDVLISENYFHDIRLDGVRGGGTSSITIEKNFFTDFFRVGSEHQDAIQFWTSGTSSSARSIVIRDNLIFRGDGSATQGIFLWDEDGRRYEDVTVSGNLAVGTTWRGITVASTTGAQVTDNLVVGLPDQQSFLYAEHTTGLDLQRNGAMRYVLPAGFVRPAGNVATSAATDEGRSLVQSWLSDHELFWESQALQKAGVEVAGSLLRGADKADTLVGAGGHDSLYGGDGNDVLIGGPGSDILDGGAGFDRVDYSASPGGVMVNLAEKGAGSDAEGDRFVSIERFDLGGFADEFVGTTLAEHVYGRNGDDTLVGGGGGDQLFGGAGRDTFAFGPQQGLAVIRDFAPGWDRIRLDGGSATTFAELGLVQEAGGVRVTWGVADAAVLLSGRTLATLKAGDFAFGTTNTSTSNASMELIGVQTNGSADMLYG